MFINGVHFQRDDGPLFFLIFSELFEFEPAFIAHTHVAEIAQDLGAAVIAIEPRFYGESRPTA